MDLGLIEILDRLKSLGNPEAFNKMIHFGINVDKAFGISIPKLRELAKEIGQDHALAQALWDSKYHEARLLACLIDDPKKVSEEQMDHWVNDFRSWDLCDHCCGNLFDKTPYASKKVDEWTKRSEEYVKRAGFALIAYLASHDKKKSDDKFIDFLEVIKREATDNRNFVKKAVNWSLRQIGKRNLLLNQIVITKAEEIRNIDSKTARWIANDAIKELTSEKVQKRLKK